MVQYLLDSNEFEGSLSQDDLESGTDTDRSAKLDYDYISMLSESSSKNGQSSKGGSPLDSDEDMSDIELFDYQMSMFPIMMLP